MFPHNDAHLHLPESSTPLPLLLQTLRGQLTDAGCGSGIMLHLEWQPWTPAEWCEGVRNVSGLTPFVNLHPYACTPGDLTELVMDCGARGLKLHPRMQDFTLTDPRTVALVREAGRLNVPVLIDGLLSWAMISKGMSIWDFGVLAETAPETRVCLAHLGGHEVMNALMMIRDIPNLFGDLSFTPLYFTHSSVPRDVAYAVWSLSGRRILYGSDFPERELRESLTFSRSLLESALCSKETLEKVFLANFWEFIGNG